MDREIESLNVEKRSVKKNLFSFHFVCRDFFAAAALSLKSSTQPSETNLYILDTNSHFARSNRVGDISWLTSKKP